MTTAAALFVERDFAVPAIRCAGCISKLEQGLVRDRRIGAARVNFTEKRVRLSCAPDAETPDLIGAFTLLGFEAHPIGEAKAQETLRTALAMGADRAILIQADGVVEPLAVAKLLAKVAEEEQPGMVILGKQAIDDDSNQTGQMLAELLGWSQGTFEAEGEIAEGRTKATREVDGGLATGDMQL